MKKEIKSKKEYHETMATIYNLMNKGERKLSKVELNRLFALSIVAELYENKKADLDLIFYSKIKAKPNPVAPYTKQPKS